MDNAGDNGAGKVVLSIPNDVKDVKEVRYAWEGFPQCLLYNGVGGYEAYTDAMPAAPWCFDVVTGAPCPVRNLPNPWAAGFGPPRTWGSRRCSTSCRFAI